VSHSFQTRHEFGGLTECRYVFHYDSGVEGGDVKIVQLMAEEETREPEDYGKDGVLTRAWSPEVQFVIPKSELVAFVAHLVRNALISKVEETTDLEVLGL